MANQTCSIELSGPAAADSADYVLIEQQPWPRDLGRTSVMQGVQAIGSMIFGGAMPADNCGGLGVLEMNVFAYPSRMGLSYRFAVSHGDCRPGAAELITRRELVRCSMEEAVQMRYPLFHLTALQWVGNCYNDRGDIVPRPGVTVVGRDIIFDRKVYGSLRVSYLVWRVGYLVRVTKREDSLENNFTSVAYAVWDGGVEYEELEPPSGYEETEGHCGNGIPGGGSVDICSPPPSVTYPAAVRADREKTEDYCSGEVISDIVTEIVDRDSDDEGDGCGNS